MHSCRLFFGSNSKAELEALALYISRTFISRVLGEIGPIITNTLTLNKLAPGPDEVEEAHSTLPVILYIFLIQLYTICVYVYVC